MIFVAQIFKSIWNFSNGEHNKKKYWITVIIVFLIVVIAVTAIVGDIAFSKKRERKYSKSIETVEEKKFMARVQKYIDVQNNFTDYIKRSRKIRLFAQSDTCAKIGRCAIINWLILCKLIT